MPLSGFSDFRAPVPRALLAAFAALLVGSGAAQACPDWQMTGRQISYTADQLWTPQTLSVVAGGSNTLANCPQPGIGYVATRPDFDLTFTANGLGRDLEFRVNANCDTVLLVNDARGQWHFDDDGGDGLNARLRLPVAPEGVYDIWVGTYGPSTCQATLTLETFGGGQVQPPYQPPVQPPYQPPVAACPDPGQNGRMLTYDGGGLYAAQRFDVVAGGNLDLGACSAVPGHGHVVTGPDFTLNLTGNPQAYDLEFRVEAGCDPVLLVNTPAGQWHYNDDADGLNSRLRLPRAAPGLYDIWVGTYGSQTCAASLYLETFGGQVRPQPQPQPTPHVGIPAVAGSWAIVANNYHGRLDLVWSGSGWSGTVRFDGGAVHTLEGIRFDPASGTIEFIRPIGGGQSQNYRGRLAGGALQGEFNQAGGPYQYAWTASQHQPQAGAMPQPSGGLPAAAGTWQIVANGYPGTLTLGWTGSGWSGVLNLHAHDEVLQDIRVDPASGAIEFTRPISGATQQYRGRLAGREMRGEFNQGGGAYQYNWNATLTHPQAGGAAPAPIPGGGASK